jgi:hypothetical protein
MLIKFAFSAIKSKLAIDCGYLFLSSLALLLPPSSLKSPTSIVTNILPLYRIQNSLSSYKIVKSIRKEVNDIEFVAYTSSRLR